MVNKDKRTATQNKALHLWFTQVAEALNAAGYSVQAVISRFKDGYELEFTPANVKEILWKSAQRGMYHKESTTELSAFKEIDEIHKVVSRFLSEKLLIPYIPFPFECDECHGLSKHAEGCSML